MSLKKIDIKKISFIIFLSLSLSPLSLLDSTIDNARIEFQPEKQNPKISPSLSNFNSSQTQKKKKKKKIIKKKTYKSFLLSLQEFNTNSKTQTSFSTVNCIHPQKNTRVFIAVVIITSIIFPFRSVANSGCVFLKFLSIFLNSLPFFGRDNSGL